jgi:hypothetical protein
VAERDSKRLSLDGEPELPAATGGVSSAHGRDRTGSVRQAPGAAPAMPVRSPDRPRSCRSGGSPMGRPTVTASRSSVRRFGAAGSIPC